MQRAGLRQVGVDSQSGGRPPSIAGAPGQSVARASGSPEQIAVLLETAGKGLVPVEPSHGPLEEMIEMFTRNRPMLRFGRRPDEIMVGGTVGVRTLWTVKGAVAGSAPYIWSVTAKGRDENRVFSKWKVGITREGSLVATKRHIVGSDSRLISWASDQTGVRNFDAKSAEMFDRLLALLPDLVSRNVPRWAMQGPGRLQAASQRTPNVLG